MEHDCKNCNEDISHKQVNARFCNPQCLKIWKTKEKFKDNTGIAECQICGMLGHELAQHIKNSHKLSVKEYETQYNTRAFSTDNLKMKSERITGSKNPAYQHNGKFSPLSDNFIHADKINKEDVKEKISKSNRENGNQPTTLKYWIKQGYNEEQATKKLSERQSTFSLKKCIEALGEEEGRQRWLDRQEKWQQVLNDKPLEERERIARAKMNDGKGFSKISQKLFWEIYINLNDKHDVYFATINDHEKDDTGKNNEYCVFTNKTIRFLDFYDKKTNKVIEFLGDYWHGEARGNQEQDRLRELEITNTIGCKILNIEERNYNNNPQEAIQECLNFLQN